MLVTPEYFLELDITDDMTYRAELKAREMGELRNSIRHGAGNVVGFLGEELVLEAYHGSISHNTYQHDITWEGMSFEVKSKDRTVKPRLDYTVSVAEFNTKQAADYYVFVSLYRPRGTQVYMRGYVLGMINKANYFQKAKFLKKGDCDPSNGWVVSADCYNLPHSDLDRHVGW